MSDPKLWDGPTVSDGLAGRRESTLVTQLLESENKLLRCLKVMRDIAEQIAHRCPEESKQLLRVRIESMGRSAPLTTAENRAKQGKSAESCVKTEKTSGCMVSKQVTANRQLTEF